MNKGPENCFFCRQLKGIGLCHLHSIKYKIDKDGKIVLKDLYETLEDDPE